MRLPWGVRSVPIASTSTEGGRLLRTDNTRGGAGPKPDVAISEEPPPADLVVEDLVVGDGEEARPGQQVSVHYVGVAWSNGSQFDASWDRGEPFEFDLGKGQVIAGWDQGVVGMRIGG